MNRREDQKVQQTLILYYLRVKDYTTYNELKSSSIPIGTLVITRTRKANILLQFLKMKSAILYKNKGSTHLLPSQAHEEFFFVHSFFFFPAQLSGSFLAPFDSEDLSFCRTIG